MERLTEKVNDYWKTNDKAHIYYLDTNESVFVGNVIDRLAEFEDFMEDVDAKSLEDICETYIKFNKNIDTIYSLKQENQALKDRWQKLKDILKKDIKQNEREFNESYIFAFEHYNNAENWVLDRMEELEKE